MFNNDIKFLQERSESKDFSHDYFCSKFQNAERLERSDFCNEKRDDCQI